MKKVVGIILFMSVICNTANSQFSTGINTDDIFYLNSNAYSCSNQAKFDSALYYYHKTIDLQEATFGHYDKRTAYSYLNLGVIYKKLYHLKKALEALNTAEDILKEVEPNSYYLSFIYNNKANIYFTYSDYAEAEIYYKNSLNHLINIDSINDADIGTVTLNLFNVIIVQNRIEEAKELINEIEKLETSTEGNYTKHLFLAQGYEVIGNIPRALKEFKLTEQSIEDVEVKNPMKQIELNYRLASVLFKQNNLIESHSLLLKNILIFHNSPSPEFLYMANTYLLIGEIHFLKGEYKNAYTWLNDAITTLQKMLSEANLDSNTNSSKILSSIFTDLKHSLARICTVLYNETGNLSYLLQSLDLYSEIIDGLKVFRLHMKNQSSKLQNTESRIGLMKEAIELAMEVYKITGEKEYIDLAFYYTENTKSFVLLSEIRSIEAMQFADLPNAILEKESGLSNEIAAYEEMIFDAKISSQPDSSLLVTLESSLFQLNDNYHTLQDSIENNYPKYFQLKYSSNFISPSAVQKNLPRNEALVEYVLSDTVLTTFVIDNYNIQVLSQEVEADFAKECFDYFTLLQNQDFSKDVHKTYREYIRMGRKFHEILVEPVLEVTESREITFIPDGAIMYLPFESFLTKDVDTEYIAYNDLPYLIYDVSVGYSYSSTMLFSPRVRSKTPERKVLAFAPSYENLLGEDEPIEWNRQANPDMLMPLPGAQEEVKFISKAVPSDVYLGMEATEEHFKEYATDYSILHLAMHTIMNDEDPMFSKLAFTRNFKDTTQDHDLYTYEIYNMKLNADMVVLSSCSSGYGKMQKGEGMMSMARGFIYAGCPSIVMTLWQVSDRSSSELMSGFYKNLRKGKTKKKALRQAKIDYIKSSDNLKSNPYFWSAFLVVGDNSPLYGRSAAVYFGIIISLFIIVVISLSYKKQLMSLIGKRK